MQQRTQQSAPSAGTLPHSEHRAHLGVGVVDDAIFVQPYNYKQRNFILYGYKKLNDTISSEINLSAVAINSRPKFAKFGKFPQHEVA